MLNENMVNALYDGGWRTSDKEQMIEEYGFSSDEIEEVCKGLKELEESYMNPQTIKVKGNYTLLKPFNAWDTNYHIMDTENEKHYMIDIHDVYEESDITDPEEFAGLMWEELKELENMENILEYSWNVVDI